MTCGWESLPSADHVKTLHQQIPSHSGLLQGSRSSVVRASTAKVGGLGFDPQWLYPCIFPFIDRRPGMLTVLTRSSYAPEINAKRYPNVEDPEQAITVPFGGRTVHLLAS